MVTLSRLSSFEFSSLLPWEQNLKGKDAAPHLYSSFNASPQPAVICDQAQQAPCTLITQIFVFLLGELRRRYEEKGKTNEYLWFYSLFSSLKKQAVNEKKRR